MGLSIRVHRDGDRTMVVSLAGPAEATMLEPLLDPPAAALLDTEVLVLDVDELVLNDAAPLGKLVLGLLDNRGGGQLRVVASHDPARAFLTELQVRRLGGVHLNLDEARRARPGVG